MCIFCNSDLRIHPNVRHRFHSSLKGYTTILQYQQVLLSRVFRLHTAIVKVIFCILIVYCDMSSIVISQLTSVATACSAKLRGSFIIMCIAVIVVLSENMTERIQLNGFILESSLVARITPAILNVSMVRLLV